MTNTPDEIKKGLECCRKSDSRACTRCAYHNMPMSNFCQHMLEEDALALIQQLQAENADQAVRIQQLEKRVIHLEALDQSNLTTITMQERTRDRLQEQISQLEVERDAMKEALGLMVYQYCVSGTELDHRYMCAGETAFRVLGLEQYGDTRTLESWLFPECQDKEE